MASPTRYPSRSPSPESKRRRASQVSESINKELFDGGALDSQITDSQWLEDPDPPQGELEGDEDVHTSCEFEGAFGEYSQRPEEYTREPTPEFVEKPAAFKHRQKKIILDLIEQIVSREILGLQDELKCLRISRQDLQDQCGHWQGMVVASGSAEEEMRITLELEKTYTSRLEEVILYHNLGLPARPREPSRWDSLNPPLHESQMDN